MGQSSRKPHKHGTHSIAYTKVVDLSRGIHPGMPLWPGDPPVEFDVAARLDSEGYFLRRFAMSEHGGTHINAPNSFRAGGASIDQYPAESLVVQASVISVLELVADNPNYQLTVADVDCWEGLHGEIKPESIVLLHTGWQTEERGTGESPSAVESHGRNFPGFGLDAARYLLNERGASGLGTDGPGVEAGTDTAFSVNKLILRATTHRIGEPNQPGSAAPHRRDPGNRCAPPDWGHRVAGFGSGLCSVMNSRPSKTGAVREQLLRVRLFAV